MEMIGRQNSRYLAMAVGFALAWSIFWLVVDIDSRQLETPRLFYVAATGILLATFFWTPPGTRKWSVLLGFANLALLGLAGALLSTHPNKCGIAAGCLLYMGACLMPTLLKIRDSAGPYWLRLMCGLPVVGAVCYWLLRARRKARR